MTTRRGGNSESESEATSEETIVLEKRFINFIGDFSRELSPATTIPAAFHPLVKKLSNVLLTVLMKGHGRQILFLGEVHAETYHRKKGHVPFSEVIVPFLETSTDVDFLFEASPTASERHNCELPPEDYARLQRAVKKKKNKTGMNILNQTRRLLHPYLPGALTPQTFPHTRVHWLDIHFDLGKEHKRDTNLAERKRTTRLLRLLSTVVLDPRASTLDDIEALLKERNPGLPFRIAFSNMPSTDRVPAQMAIFHAMMNMFIASVLDKCFAAKRNVSITTYLRVFQQMCFSLNVNRLEFYFQTHRFFMDMYTCCRLLKVEDHWYTTMVVYTGSAHTVNCVRLLRTMGFTAHLV
jgi:hypothetical protein